MVNLVRDFERYLKETLDLSVALKKWEGAGRLPFFLRDLYAFFQGSLLDTPCLVMAVRDQNEQTPATVRKHLMQVREKWGGEVIFLRPSISAYNRKRLIEHKVPFVVPGNQMYLPMLGIDLREHFRKIRSARPRFSPSTQTVVLYALLHEAEPIFTPSGLAIRLGYTPMTLTRAFDELESVGLGEVIIEGRERVLRFGETKRSLWEKAQAHLRSPVKKRTFLRYPQGEGPGLPAGLTALAHYTLLAPPANPVYALSAEDWNSLKQRREVVELAIPEPEPLSLEIEIWNYPPRLFAEDEVVDRFSLYLSLRDNLDERVQSALGKMMETAAW